METLTTRAFCLQLCRLMPSRSNGEKQLGETMRRVRRILAANPAKAGGRHEFFKHLFRMVHRKKDDGHPWTMQKPPQELKQWTMAKHGVLWAGRALREQADWTHLAERVAAERTIGLAEELKSLSDERALLEARLEEFAHQDGPVTMSSASVDEQDIAAINSLLTSSSFRTRARVEAARAKAMRTPLPLTDHRLRDLAQFVVWSPPKIDMPPWADVLARHRDAFVGCALVVADETGVDQVWQVVYIVQNPVYIAVCRMTPLHSFEAAPVEGEPVGAWGVNPQRFKINFANFATAADMPDTAVDDMRVLLDVEYSGRTALRTAWCPNAAAGLSSLASPTSTCWSGEEVFQSEAGQGPEL